MRREWGEGPYKSVVDTLVERKEYDFDGTLACDLWNYKEGRKATLGECIDYLLDQVKQLTIIRRRKSRRLGIMSGIIWTHITNYILFGMSIVTNSRLNK